MIKIGFLFLTQREFTQQDLWEKYFTGISKSNYEIVIHSKPDFKHQIFQDKQIPSVETTWIGFELIKAQHLLLQKALQDKNITHFIFISETTIPIQSFSSFYNYITKIGDKSVFDSQLATATFHLSRLQTINNILDWKSNNWYLNPQWVMFSRQHALQITENYNTIETIFNHSEHSSEHAYSNFLINNNLLNTDNYINKNLTHIDWNGLNGSYPSSYFMEDLTDVLIKNLITQDLFFLRKVQESRPLPYSKFICDLTQHLLLY